MIRCWMNKCNKIFPGVSFLPPFSASHLSRHEQYISLQLMPDPDFAEKRSNSSAVLNVSFPLVLFFLMFNVLINPLNWLILKIGRLNETEMDREWERNINLLFHLFMHSLIILYVPHWGLNPQPWCVGTARPQSCS